MICSKVKCAAQWLTIIGGLNWGLVGVANFNLVEWLGAVTGQMWLPQVVYIVVGVSAAFVAVKSITCCKKGCAA